MNPFVGIFDFTRVRTWWEAFGFLFAWFVFLGLIATGISFLYGPLLEETTGIDSERAGQLFLIIAHPYLAYMILYRKKQIKEFKFFLIAVFSGLGTVVFGSFGLIITAYLTIIPNKK